MTLAATRRLLPFALLAAVLAVVFVVPSSDSRSRSDRAKAKKAASTKVHKAIWGPARIGSVSQFPIYKDLGAKVWQANLRWTDVAQTRPADPRDPDDPAYEWPTELDFAVQEARKHRIDPLLLVNATPGWANGGEPVNVPPVRARDYADFLEAASKRYPTIRFWMVWGEPHRFFNYRIPLAPPERDVRAGLTREQKLGVRTYAQLLDTAYGRMAKLSKRHRVIGVNSTTTGDIVPFEWLRNMRLANGKPPRMHMVGHNPFGAREPDLDKKQAAYGTADFSDLDTYWRWVDRYLRRSGRNSKVKLFISEYNAPTGKGYEFPYFVTERTQSKWIRSAFREARKTRRVYALGWHSLYDIPERESDGLGSPTGLITADGRKKPGYRTFKAVK